MKWLKYSGVWFGFVVNPYHWRFEWDAKPITPDVQLETALYLGPVWIRVVIDDGEKW